jgi:hypothetical protein
LLLGAKLLGMGIFGTREGSDAEAYSDSSKRAEKREGLKTLPYDCAADGYNCACFSGAIFLGFAGQTWVGWVHQNRVRVDRHSLHI